MRFITLKSFNTGLYWVAQEQGGKTTKKEAVMFVGLKPVPNLFNFEFTPGNDIGVNAFSSEFFLSVRFSALNRSDNLAFHGSKL